MAKLAPLFENLRRGPTTHLTQGDWHASFVLDPSHWRCCLDLCLSTRIGAGCACNTAPANTRRCELHMWRHRIGIFQGDACCAEGLPAVAAFCIVQWRI